MRHRPLTAATLSLALFATPTRAGETIRYGYDSRGRLVQIARGGSVNDGVATLYTFDRADNRLSKTVGAGGTGSLPAAPRPSFAVSDASVVEGGVLQFTVTKSGATSSGFSVD